MKNTSMMIPRLLILSALLIASPSLVRAAVVTGQVTECAGHASVVSPSGTSTPIADNTPVPVGSRIETSADSQLKVQWVSGAFSVLTQDTVVAIKSLNFSIAHEAPKRVVSLDLTRGSLFSSLARHDGSSDFRVNTPSGVAAARGTKWKITVDPDGTVTVSVVEGTVSFKNVRGVTSMIDAGYMMVFHLNGVSARRPLSPPEITFILNILERDLEHGFLPFDPFRKDPIPEVPIISH